MEAQMEIAKEREARKQLLPQRRARIEAIGDDLWNPIPADDDILDMDGPAFEGYFTARIALQNQKEQEKIDAQKRRIEEERAKLEREKEIREREERARQEERYRLEREQKEQEARAKREKEERERKEHEEQERLEREARYQEFLTSHGYSVQTADEFLISRSDAEVKLYKLVGTFKIK